MTRATAVLFLLALSLPFAPTAQPAPPSGFGADTKRIVSAPYPLVAQAVPRTEPKAEPVKLEAEKVVTRRVGQECVLTASTNAKKVTWEVPPGVDALPLDGKRLAVWAVEGTYHFRAMVPSGDDVLATKIILTITGPRPPPVPPDPPGPMPVPPPTPVTSFRVIFVKESGVTLPPEQSSIPAAKVIRDYCNAKTTPEGSLTGWREYDPQQNTTGELPNMKALWDAVKPKLTTFPCLVIERNGRAEILPFPASVNDCMTVLKSYGGP